jgi:hypothetical protein
VPRRWLLRLVALAIGFLPFVLLEAALQSWSSRPAAQADPFLDCSRLKPLFIEAEPGRMSIPEARLRLFAPATFDVSKPRGTKRIFALGGSTTQGEPYGPPTAFPEWLKTNLEIASPGEKFEVVNCGGLSYASYRVLAILREVLEYDPDLIVVYTGQNEFLEQRELSGWSKLPTPLVRSASLVNSLRSVKLFRNCFHPAKEVGVDARSTTELKAEVDALLDYQGGLEKYQRSNLHREAVAQSFQWNLRAIVEECLARTVPVVLVVPTVNLKDCPPFKYDIDPTLHAEDHSVATEHWSKIESLVATDDSRFEFARKLLSIDPQHAGALYLLGRRALDACDWEEAERMLQAAKDFDVCPLRATQVIQQVVRDIAAEYKLPIVDADRLFQSLSPRGIVGREWLVDHIHPTIEGHQKIGEELCRVVIYAKLVKTKKPIMSQDRTAAYRQHLSTLGEDYFLRGKQRLEGLMLWTQGRAKKILKEADNASRLSPGPSVEKPQP